MEKRNKVSEFFASTDNFLVLSFSLAIIVDTAVYTPGGTLTLLCSIRQNNVGQNVSKVTKNVSD